MIEQLTVETLHKSLVFYHAFVDDISVPYPTLFVRNPEHYFKAWTSILSLGLGTIFLYEEDPLDPLGILLATLTPDMFDGRLTATEHAWYVMPHARGGTVGRELLAAFESWAGERNAAKLILSHFIHGMPDLEASFGKRGYTALEKHYMASRCARTS